MIDLDVKLMYNNVNNREGEEVIMEIGDKIYLKPTGNRARYDSQDKSIREYEIKKIGRKYFEVWQDNKQWTVIKFRIEDNRQATEYSDEWILYFSEQDAYDEEEKLEICKELRNFFDSYKRINMPLDKMKQIIDIVNEYK